MCLFGATHEWCGQKGSPSLKSVTHIIQRWNLGLLMDGVDKKAHSL